MTKADRQLDKVRRALRTMVLTGRATEANLAARFSMSPRSLHRMLAGHDTNFKKLLDGVRFDISRELLMNTDVSAAVLAASLGYAEASAFNRAFRRWTGSPPGAWRTQSRLPSPSSGIES